MIFVSSRSVWIFVIASASLGFCTYTTQPVNSLSHRDITANTQSTSTYSLTTLSLRYHYFLMLVHTKLR